MVIEPGTPPMIATSAMPRMASATNSSISVSPRSSETIASNLDLVEDSVHRAHQGDRHEADQAAHHDDHQRLEQRGQLLDLVVQLALVVHGGRRQLVIQRAGLLTDPNHP